MITRNDDGNGYSVAFRGIKGSERGSTLIVKIKLGITMEAVKEKPQELISVQALNPLL